MSSDVDASQDRASDAWSRARTPSVRGRTQDRNHSWRNRVLIKSWYRDLATVLHSDSSLGQGSLFQIFIFFPVSWPPQQGPTISAKISSFYLIVWGRIYLACMAPYVCAFKNSESIVLQFVATHALTPIQWFITSTIVAYQGSDGIQPHQFRNNCCTAHSEEVYLSQQGSEPAISWWRVQLQYNPAVFAPLNIRKRIIFRSALNNFLKNNFDTGHVKNVPDCVWP